MRDCLKDRYKVALCTDDKEIELNKDGLFDKNIDVVTSTSSIQNRQSIKENILSIFVQTYIDILKQFLGRNQNRDSDVLLYVRYGMHMNKRNYLIHTMDMRNTWTDYVITHGMKCLKQVEMTRYTNSVIQYSVKLKKEMKQMILRTLLKRIITCANFAK